MKNVTILLAALSISTLAACEGGDGGEATCLRVVELWNDCSADANDLDPDVYCDTGYFEAAISAGCSWESYFQSCVDSFECDTAQSEAACVYEGTCE